MSALTELGDTAKNLAKNPLGIIALFIVLIYGFASLVVGLSGQLNAQDRTPIVWFLVIFPCLVLGVFTWLVSRHHEKLYAPSDYKKDEAFLKTIRTQDAFMSIGAATAKMAAEGVPAEEIQRVTKEATENVVKLTSSVTQTQKNKKRVLWVDDRPNNNIYERQALEAFGFQFVLSDSTEDAIEKINKYDFSVIISDMGRPPDLNAGYTLLESLRKKGIQTPFLIYAGSNAVKHENEALRRGAQGSTNRPDMLFQMVINAAGMNVDSTPC